MGFIILSQNLQQNFGLMVSSSVIEALPVTLFISSCLECSRRSLAESLISVTTEISDAFKTFLPSYFGKLEYCFL